MPVGGGRTPAWARVGARQRPRRAAGAGPRESEVYARIYAAVRHVPRGRVATYGQIARLVGLPGRARQVGYALRALSDERVPWHRVINAKGEISARAEPGAEALQRRLLERERVAFDADGRVSLRRFGWEPDAGPRPRRVRAR